jgi:phosphoribulokinase
LWALRDGHAIHKPIYDHADGKIKGPQTLEPKAIVVVQGLFPLYTRALRGLFDVTVWLDPETELKVAWKIQRDMRQRGYTAEQVRAEIEKRQPDIRAHIAPQAAFADLTVRFSRPATWSTNPDDAHLTAHIRKSGRFVPLDYSEFASTSTHLRQLATTSAHGHPETIIELDGQIADEVAQAVQDKIWAHMDSHAHLRPERLGEFNGPQGPGVSHSLALAQLLIARRVVLIENAMLEAAGAVA